MEFGVGRGSSSTEQKGFGIQDPELTKLMVDEVFPQFKRMWSTTDYRFDGEYFSMPPRNVLPKPYTDPHPPLWIAAGNPSTFEKAARMGVGVLCFAMGAPDMLKGLVEIYKNTIDQAEPVGEYVNNNVMITSQMLCLNDGQKAREISCDMNGSYQNSLVFHYLDTFPKPPFVPDWPELIPEPTLEEMEQRIQAGRVVVGTPEECEKAVQGYVDTGADQLVFGQLSSTMPIDVAVESIETFGRELIPVFDKDPVHSTTRQREAYVSARGPRVQPDRPAPTTRFPSRRGMGECDGRVALVTGASRGIGAAIALRLAAEGAAVAVTARTLDPHPTLPGTLREVVDAVEAHGGSAVAIPADLADADDRSAHRARGRVGARPRRHPREQCRRRLLRGDGRAAAAAPPAHVRAERARAGRPRPTGHPGDA